MNAAAVSGRGVREWSDNHGYWGGVTHLMSNNINQVCVRGAGGGVVRWCLEQQGQIDTPSCDFRCGRVQGPYSRGGGGGGRQA